MKNFVIYSLVFAIFLQSCSSIIYSPQKRRENNSFEINSNFNNYSINYSKTKNQSPTKIDWNKYRVEKLTRKNTFLTLSSPSCEDIKIKLNRSPRVSILLLDLPSIVYLLGIPLVVDLVSANFYKIPQQRKVINVNFQRTNEYFKDKILSALNSSNEKILDEISNENPNREILNQIELTRNEIIKLNLFSDIKILNSIKNSKYEYYLTLKSKYQNKLSNNILDSLKLQVQLSEITNLKNNNDIIGLVKLSKIAEQDFLINLKQLKPEIEKNAFNKIVSNYDFKLINELLSLDPDNKNNLLNVKKETEVHLVNEVSQTNNLSLIDKHYNKLEEITKFKLDEIRAKIIEVNKKNELNSEIIEVNKLVANKNFKDALDKINSIYPNDFADDSEENINIKKIKKNASDNYENQKIIESILFIDDEIYNGNFPFDDINNLFDNPFLSLSQKNNLTLVKKNLEIKYQKIKQLEANEQARIEKQEKIEEIKRLNEEKKAEADALRASKAKKTTTKSSNIRDGSDVYHAIPVEPTELEDFPAKYVGKWIVTYVEYYSSDNSGHGLGILDDPIRERLLTMNTHGFSINYRGVNDELVETHTRAVRVNGERLLYLRIPIIDNNEIHNGIPNVSVGTVVVLGFLRDKQTLVTLECQRELKNFRIKMKK